MKVTKTNLFYFSIIALNVAVAYAISKFEGAISPLFMSMVMGLIFVNAGGWSDKGKEAASFATKTLPANRSCIAGLPDFYR